ncbi:hypothetical protein D021_1882A, partial [Vibrio parahaemolyticus 10296]
MAKKLVKT